MGRGVFCVEVGSRGWCGGGMLGGGVRMFGGEVEGEGTSEVVRGRVEGCEGWQGGLGALWRNGMSVRAYKGGRVAGSEEAR